LKQHLSATKTIADLSAKTGVDATLLEKWINEEVPVPVDMQKLIAVWLDKDARTLFTDVPPAVTT
jgi:transcriptional regulator with XRE-family HTH domain